MLHYNTLITWLLCAPLLAVGQQYMQVSGNEIQYNGQKVYLSGMNQAWYNFGRDFGNNFYDSSSGVVLEDFLQRISEAGGNSIRIWIHTDGRATPQFDGDGYVLGTDSQGTMTRDLGRYLDKAREYDMLVIPVLWNGATSLTTQLRDLLWDDSKLQSYIDNALKPMVRALKNKVSLGAWEIMNEPEGILHNDRSDAYDCYDTTPLRGSGAGWANEYVPMERILRFINWQFAAIKEEDPKALATIGSWSARSQTDNFGRRDYYKDRCLQAAGGQSLGTIDFYQMHSYAWQGNFPGEAPLVNHNSAYGITKPNVVGEFSEDGGDGRDMEVYFDWLYEQGYSGAWTWHAVGTGTHSDDFDTQARGTNHIRHRNNPNQGGRVQFQLIG